MTDKIERNPNGSFKKGANSPNPKGRGKGIRNKKMTTSQVADFIGKRQQSYFQAIEDLGYNSKELYVEEFNSKTGEMETVENKMLNPDLSLKCFKELISVGIQAEIFEHKKLQDKKKGGKGSGKDEPKEEEPDMSGVLKAIK
jgi:hypothetical protein